MSNQYYDHGDSAPAPQTRGTSAGIRAELDLVAQGFAKLPAPDVLWTDNANFAVAGGTADLWTASVAPTLVTALTDGMQVRVRFAQSNATTTPSLNVNGLGAKTIALFAGGAVAAGDIAQDRICTLVYSAGTDNFRLQQVPTTATAGGVSYGGGTVQSYLDGLAAPSGSSLVGFLQAGTGAVATTAQQALRNWGTAEQYGAAADGVTDDTAAILRCIVAKGACFLIPGKTYICDGLNLPAGACVFSVGRLAILKQPAAPVSSVLYANSGSSSATVGSIHVFGITLQGQVSTQGFSQFVHLVSVNGVRDFIIEDCRISGFRGDGLYIGSGGAGDERHNFNVRVLNCDFDGENSDNRNAISVIDVDGLQVQGCSFANCTRANMPGAIDLEPDGYAFHIMRNVRIALNKFDSIGGNTGAINVAIPAAVTNTARSIHVLDNQFTNVVTAVTFQTSRAPTDTSEDNDLQIIGNFTKGATQPLSILDGKRVVVERNTFVDSAQALLLGYIGATNQTRDVTVAHNKLVRVGSGASSGLSIFTLNYGDIHNNTFDDCGQGTAGNNYAIDLNTGSSSYLKINKNVFVSPTGKTAVVIQKEAAHTLAPDTNQFYGNTIPTGWNNFFQAQLSDTLETGYTPVIEGASTAGLGTYTRQYGRFQRIGKRVFVTVEIVVTSHTGTGMIQVSLPVQAAASSNNELRTMALSMDGVATTGGQIGQMNPGAAVGGITGAVRCYYSATGTLSQATIPAGAFTIRFNGSYEAV